MKLTKEECMKSLVWFRNQVCMGCVSEYPDCCSKCIEKYNNTLKQIIDEHFESSASRVESSLTRYDNDMTTTLTHMESQVDKLTIENSQLRYDLKFIDINYREAVDHMNEFLEKTIELEKALDKACELLVEATSQVHDIYDEMLDDYSWINSKDEWKEYLLK